MEIVLKKTCKLVFSISILSIFLIVSSLEDFHFDSTSCIDQPMASDSTLVRQPSFFISHGGGPCFFLDDEDGLFAGMNSKSDARKWYESMASKHFPQKPKNILVISAHWEERPFTVTTRPKTKLLYDYYGFPADTYQLQYNCPHSPQLVDRLKKLMGDAKLELVEDNNRGLDHGVFIPLKMVVPAADIPVVQLSLHGSLDADLHFKLGQALAPLRDEGTVIIASGQMTHNMSARSLQTESWVFDWTSYVTDAATNPKYTAEERKTLLLNWKQQKSARKAHPREEHWIPFFVALGASYGPELKAERIFDKNVGSFSLECIKFTS